VFKMLMILVLILHEVVRSVHSMISTRADVHLRRNELDSEGRQYSKTASLS
jgi:hypothetical protein